MAECPYCGCRLPQDERVVSYTCRCGLVWRWAHRRTYEALPVAPEVVWQGRIIIGLVNSGRQGG